MHHIKQARELGQPINTRPETQLLHSMLQQLHHPRVQSSSMASAMAISLATTAHAMTKSLATTMACTRACMSGSESVFALAVGRLCPIQRQRGRCSASTDSIVMTLQRRLGRDCPFCGVGTRSLGCQCKLERQRQEQVTVSHTPTHECNTGIRRPHNMLTLLGKQHNRRKAGGLDGHSLLM
jgi:hypothetical protein